MSLIERSLPFENAAIYSILHESIYCTGQASNWSAYRILQEQPKVFDIPKDEGEKPIYFTGEMVGAA